MFVYSEVSKGTMTQEDAIALMQSGEPIKRTVKRTKTIVTANHPTLRVCEYDRLIIDPTCEGDLEKAQFIVVPFETSYSELMSDGKYKNLDKIFSERVLYFKVKWMIVLSIKQLLIKLVLSLKIKLEKN